MRRLPKTVVGFVAASLLLAPAAPASADSTRAASWQLEFLRVADAQRISQGEGITVAVIDSGVDPNHPDLRGNVLDGVDAWNVNSPDRGHRDTLAHGTGVAALIAGHGHGPGGRDGVLGLAPKAKILPINVRNPAAPYIHPDLVGDAIRYAVQQGAQVICVSIAGGHSDKQRQGLAEAAARGVPVIAAAGNRPEDISVGFPAAEQGAIAVSSVDRAGTFAAKTSVSGPEVSISAPGVGVPMAVPGGGYRVATGTSAATAFVAGTAALVRSAHPDDDQAKLVRRLLWTSADSGDRGRDQEYGWGVLNPVDALTKEPREPARAADTPNDLSGLPQRTGEKRADINWSELFVIVPVAVLFWGAVVLFGRWRRKRPTTAAGSPPDKHAEAE